MHPGAEIRALPLVGSSEWWQAQGRGGKQEHPLAWCAPDSELGRLIGDLKRWLPGQPSLVKAPGSEADLDALLATASERKVRVSIPYSSCVTTAALRSIRALWSYVHCSQICIFKSGQQLYQSL
jgi:hypothetical protein